MPRPTRPRPTTPPDFNQLAQRLSPERFAAVLAAYYRRQADAAGEAWVLAPTAWPSAPE